MGRESKKNGKLSNLNGDDIDCSSNINKQQQEKLLKKKNMLASNKNSKHAVSENNSKQNNNNNNNSNNPLTNCGDVEIIINNNKHNNHEDDDDDDSINKGNGCLKKVCLFIFLLMGITLILSAIIYAIVIFPTLLDNENQCFDYKYSFQQTNFKLFSTKTTYSTSYQQLNQTSSSSVNNLLLLNRIEIPNIFSKKTTLKQLHDNLINDLQCKVKQFHFIGRHAARFPSSKNIDQINKLLLTIQNKIDLTKYTPNNNNNKQILNQTTNPTTQTTTVCLNPLAEYKSWTSLMIPEQGNLITDFGFYETENIAKRFKQIYPDLFDAKLANIEFGSTKELRTAQTAIAFLKQIENFNLDFCDSNSLKILLNDENHLSDSSMVNSILTNDCLRKFIEFNYKEKLEFHNKCESLHEIDYPISHNLNLNEPNRTKTISVNVSKKLKLNKDQYLTHEETLAIYKMCKYETALIGNTNSATTNSIWCNLFSENDLKFYEYLEDIKYFFEVYGHPDQAKSACPITKDLLNIFKEIEKQSTISSVQGEQQQQQQQLEAKFYFTHSEVIQKLIASMIDLESVDKSYLTKNILSYLDSGTTPNNRQWRTSLLSPFSANIAFTLYQCPIARSSSFNNNNNNNNQQVEYKLITSLNEQPILIDGCQDFVCSINSLLEDSRIFTEKRCKLEDICKKKFIIT